MNVIISAYSCHPDRGSEPGIGWNWFNEICKYHNVWLFFFHDEGQYFSITEAVKNIKTENEINLIPIAVPKWMYKPIFRRIKYHVWQIKAFKKALTIIENNHIDLIHQTTFGTWWFTGYWWKLNKPYILGPMSGGQNTPPICYPFLTNKGQLYEKVRTLLSVFLWKTSKRYKKAISMANKVIIVNDETLHLINGIVPSANIYRMIDVGVDKVPKVNRNKNQKLNLLWIGLLTHRKNFGLVIESLSRLPDSMEWSLYVLGEGELRNHWERVVQKTNLAGKIHFFGAVEYQKTRTFYENADIFLFSSLREATATVLVEAMSYGIPIVALKLNGAKWIIDDSTGVLVEINNKEQIVNDYKDAIIKLGNDSVLRQKMGANAIEKVKKHHLWTKRAETMNTIYTEIISQHSND